ncbi:MAG: TIGR03618 family F420-dependent PPOX class oxidoreductase [Deltaproteobacteria bacterium]|nr:TIGR03618 family F420-dependent PPOX class oxidoreductase [Deltaproteobacteria bacterium]
MDITEAKNFISKHHHGVLVTRKRNGEPQMSPVSPALDGHGRVIISTRETAFKIKNLRRDPRASLCVFTEAFHRLGWVQVDGKAEVISLPEALELLMDWHQRVKGEHPNWEEYKATLEKQRRVMLRIEILSAGPQVRG